MEINTVVKSSDQIFNKNIICHGSMEKGSDRESFQITGGRFRCKKIDTKIDAINTIKSFVQQVVTLYISETVT